MQLKIDREFESKIPPLTAEEFRQLEENIVTWFRDFSTA